MPSSRRGDTGAEGAAALAERLGHTFSDLTLLQQALAHRSWCGEQEGGAPSNERLEFLGDAVLGAVVALFTYQRYPDFPEGMLAKVRSAVVNARATSPSWSRFSPSGVPTHTSPFAAAAIVSTTLLNKPCAVVSG